MQLKYCEKLDLQNKKSTWMPIKSYWVHIYSPGWRLTPTEEAILHIHTTNWPGARNCSSCGEINSFKSYQVFQALMILGSFFSIPVRWGLIKLILKWDVDLLKPKN